MGASVRSIFAPTFSFMRAILFHTKKYGAVFDSFATRPAQVRPEQEIKTDQRSENCVTVLLTVEKRDDIECVSSGLAQEINKMCTDVGRDQIVLVPFAHLSNTLADSDLAQNVLSQIEYLLKKDFRVIRAHFGSHKSLLLDVYGHPGNVRYREF